MKRHDARAEADRPAATAIAAAEGGALVRPGPVAPSWAAASPHARMLLTLRLRRRRRFLLRLAVFVALPTLATAGYFLLFASPRYVAELQLTYQTYQPVQSLSAGLVQSVAGTSQSNSVDLGAIIYQYVRSAALLRQLDGTLGLRAAFSSPDVDWMSRMSPHASQAAFLRVFRRRVSVSEGLGGYLTIDVEAAGPKPALDLAEAVAQACDRMVGEMSARARRDELDFAAAEVARQEERVRQARGALAAYQDLHRDLDPARMAGQLGAIVGTLESDLAVARTQLAQSVPFLSPGSPVIVQIRTRIASLEDQLRREQGRLAGPAGSAGSGGTPYSQTLAEYARLQLDEEFARTAYTSAEQGLVVARADAARKQDYLIDFVPPVLPDQPSLDTPLTVTLSVFLGTLLGMAAISLVAGALRDQAGV